jgi:hypothetical protein
MTCKKMCWRLRRIVHKLLDDATKAVGERVGQFSGAPTGITKYLETFILYGFRFYLN